MIPSDFSLNDPHSTEEEMRHLVRWRKVGWWLRRVVASLGGRIGLWSRRSPRAKRGVHTRERERA